MSTMNVNGLSGLSSESAPSSIWCSSSSRSVVDVRRPLPVLGGFALPVGVQVVVRDELVTAHFLAEPDRGHAALQLGLDARFVPLICSKDLQAISLLSPLPHLPITCTIFCLWRCSSLDFSTLALSHCPFSIIRISGRILESVGAVPGFSWIIFS